MPAVLSSPFAPNTLFLKEANNITTWFVVGMSGTGYASLAACKAAGDVPFPYGNAANPGLDYGMILQTFTLAADAAGAAGNGFYFALNQATQPASTALGQLVPTGDVASIAGPIWNIWIKKETGTDKIEFLGKY